MSLEKPSGTLNLQPRELSAEEFVRREEEKAAAEVRGAKWNDYLLHLIRAKGAVAARRAEKRKAYASS